MSKVLPLGAFVRVDGVDGFLQASPPPAGGEPVPARVVAIDAERERFALEAAWPGRGRGRRVRAPADGVAACTRRARPAAGNGRTGPRLTHAGATEEYNGAIGAEGGR